jgi:hypothetical protein
MIWVYRVFALACAGFGLYWLLTDLPPHDPMEGVGFYLGLYWLFLPGAVNLINALVGKQNALVRGVAVVANLGFLAHWGYLTLSDEFSDTEGLLLYALVFLALSVAFGWSWSKAPKEKE